MSYTDSLPLPPRTLTEVEQARLLKATAEHARGYRDHLIISAALGTALREAELLALNIGDVFSPDGRSPAGPAPSLQEKQRRSGQPAGLPARCPAGQA